MWCSFLSLLVVAQSPMPPTSAAPVTRPLFANEKWYQDAKGEEKVFDGVLKIHPGEGRIGMPARFNSFHLIALDDGKPVIRQIHLSGKDYLLSPFIGHNVKLKAKLVESEATGGKPELWPAQIEVLGLAPTDFIAEWKILARVNNYSPNRQGPAVPQPTIIRTARHLADYMGLAAAGAGNLEETATTRMNALLGSAKIDWSKHMLIAIGGNPQRSNALPVEITKITFGDKGLDVHWKLGGQNPTGQLRMVEIVLVNKFDGDTTFHRDGLSRPYVIPGPVDPPKEAEKADPATKKGEEEKKPADPMKK
jgi:hypothetical protein